MEKVIYINDELKNVDRLTDSDKQTIAERLVRDHIHYCTSYLISELSQDPNSTYIDQILEFSVKYEDLDPEEAAQNDGWLNWDQYKNSSRFDKDDLENELGNHDIDPNDKANYFYQVNNNGIIDIQDHDLNWYTLCDYNGIYLDDDYPTEALEHWIVSDWLESKLSEYGQLTTNDFLGLTIWGRTTSGQAICLDHVIQQIAINAYSFDDPNPAPQKEKIDYTKIADYRKNLGGIRDNY